MATNEIRSLISQGKVKEAIDRLEQLVRGQGSNDTVTEVALLSGSYKKNERDNRMGIISSDDYLRNRNKVTVSVLELLTGLDDTSTSPETTTPVPVNNSTGQHTPAESGPTSILFLASNPTGTGMLQLEKEHSRVSRELQTSPTSENFKIVPTQQATTFRDLQKYLVTLTPDIVHFSGHGIGEKRVQSEDTRFMEMQDQFFDEQGHVKKDTGIVLSSYNQRGFEVIKTDVIKEVFKYLANKKKPRPIQLVLFNSCFSHAQAEAIASHAEYVIGTTSAVKDEAAIDFATSFYLGIAQGEGIKDAFSLGRMAAMIKGEPIDRFIIYQNGEKLTDL